GQGEPVRPLERAGSVVAVGGGAAEVRGNGQLHRGGPDPGPAPLPRVEEVDDRHGQALSETAEPALHAAAGPSFTDSVTEYHGDVDSAGVFPAARAPAGGWDGCGVGGVGGEALHPHAPEHPGGAHQADEVVDLVLVEEHGDALVGEDGQLHSGPDERGPLRGYGNWPVPASWVRGGQQ